jgi:hypothetical protein
MPQKGTAGSINFALAGRHYHAAAGGRFDPHNPAFTSFHRPRKGRVTAWEEASELPCRSWSPLADAACARHMLRLIRHKLELSLASLRGFGARALGVAAILLAPGRRIAHAPAHGVGCVLGLLATSGFWLWHLRHLTGNPLLPDFNDWFRSPLGPVGDNRTRHAMPRDIREARACPFVFTRAPWRIGSVARDPKLVLACLIVPVGIVAALLRGRTGRNADAAERLGFLLLVTAAATSALWLFFFAI